MEERPDKAVGGLLIAIVSFPVVLMLVLMVAMHGWTYSVLYILFLALVLGTLMLVFVAFVRLGTSLGEWPFFVLATLAVPGSFGLIVLLRRWELNESWWSGLFAMIVGLGPLLTWFVAVWRLGADAPPMRQEGRETYRIAIGWRIFAWVCGIGFAGAPLGAWLQQGGGWTLAWAVAWVVVGSLFVACLHRKRVVVDGDMLRVRTCLYGWRSQPLANLRRIVPPAEQDRQTGSGTLRFAGGGELPIPAILAGREALLAELRRHLPEDPLDA